MINFKRVSDLLYRGGRPEKQDIPYLKKKYGIQQIISLDKNIGNALHKTILDNGMKHLIIPINSSNSLDKDLETLKNVTKLIGNKRTFVHCRHGKDRTGLFVAKYRVEHGWDCTKAIKEALPYGFGIGLDNDVILAYLDIIIGSCKSKHEHFSLGKIMKSIKSNRTFVNDAILKNAQLLFITDFIGKEDPQEEKEETTAVTLAHDSVKPELDQSMVGGGNCGSTLWSAAFRKKILLASVQQQSFKIPDHLKASAKQCLTELEKLIHGKLDQNNEFEGEEYRKLMDTLDIIYIPFKENAGITPEQAKVADKHFEVYDKLVKAKMLDLKQRALKCIDFLDEFKTDKEVSSILDSLIKQISEAQEQIDALSIILEDYDNVDFQQNVVKQVELIKKTLSQIKYFIEERVMNHIKKEILNIDWVSDLKSEIKEDKKEEIESTEEK